MIFLKPEDYDNQIFDGVGWCTAHINYEGLMDIWEGREPYDWATVNDLIYNERYGGTRIGFHFYGYIILL